MVERNKLTINNLLTIGVMVATLSGFYYLTNYRIERLEKQVEKLDAEARVIIKLEERMRNLEKKTDEIYDILKQEFHKTTRN